MKHWTRILFIAILSLVLIYSAIYVFIILKAKPLLIKSLEDFTHKKVSVGYLDLTPPLNINIRNLNIEGLLNVESISIAPSILYFLTGNIALNRVTIIRPQINYERRLPEASEAAGPGAPPTAEAAGAPIGAAAPIAAPAQNRPLHLILKRFNIRDGKINFIDRTTPGEGIKLVLKDINAGLTNLYLVPQSAITNFDLKGSIPWQEGKEEGRITAEGWLNLYKKDIQALLKIENIDGIYLYPYYSNWVDLEKARIEKATLNFTSNIQGLNNNVTADCHLELTDIVRKPRPADEPAEKAAKIADAVLDIFRALNQGKIVLDFTIKTKMDRPEFGFGNIKAAFEDKLAKGREAGGVKAQDVLMLPAKLLEGVVKGATDVSKAVVDGTFAVGKEIKNSVEDAFKKER